MHALLRPLVACLLVIGALAMLPSAASAADQGAPPGSEDDLARGYHRLLLEHTRWAESVWDEAAGHYKLRDYDFAVVLGNAVVLTYGAYDEALAGISRSELEDHTLRSIGHFAASDRWVDPAGEWGGNVYFDSTFESYLVAAAHVLWADLDPQTRANVDTLTRGIADYVAGLGAGADPRSPGWLTNGLNGGFRGDTKLEEMGARAMPLAAAVAYLPGDPSAPRWREWLNRWALNVAGLPAADAANPTPIDGLPVAAWNSSHNIHDSFAVENHGSFAPHYQEAVDAYPGRNAAQFVIAGQPVPQALLEPPNAEELARTLRRVGTDSGVGAFPMVADRYHLYGRDILPLAYQSVVGGSPDAARAERMLLEHLEPYLHHPPEFRLTKFSGEPHYEPEARAEVAMAYVLHLARGRLSGEVQPVSEDDYFRRASSVTDFGPDVGMVAQQTSSSLAMAVSKPGFAKFAFLPQHDDWLLDASGANPSFLPSTALPVTGRAVHVYRRARDGMDASATLLRTPAGLAGYATLPTGTVVYATSGVGSGEGALRVHNLTMPGVRGLDGDRTFYAADGAVTLPEGPGGDGGIDEVPFAPAQARYVRFLGVRPATAFGYSLWDFEVYGGTDGADLARGRTTTASSSFGTGFEPSRATDGSSMTRWAVARNERTRADSWLAVDLGSPQTVSRVRSNWETAYGAAYRIQVSDDGSTWRDVASVPPGRELSGTWLNLEGRVGFVVRGSTNPIRVDSRSITLSDGPASASAGMVVEAAPDETPPETEQRAASAAPSGGPPTLRASLADGYLSLFNLGAQPVAGAEVRLPAGDGVPLYRGTQRTVDGGTVYDVSLEAADARVEPPRFVLRGRDPGSSLPPLRVTVADSQTVTIANLASRTVAALTLDAADGSDSAQVTVPAGQEQTVVLRHVARTPVADLALTQTTFPTSPPPAGMSDPDLAVDGDPTTAWRPGPAGRMVVDLGGPRMLQLATLHWTPGDVPPVRISVSDDGISYRTIADSPPGSAREASLPLDGSTGRYVAIEVPGWREVDASLGEIGLFADPGDAPGN